MGHEVKQTFYNAKDVRTRCIEAGSGKPIIFLHGTGGHAEAYTRNIVEHAKHFHVYAVDMVGHGYSDMPDLNYNYEDYVNWLRDFVDTIGADKVSVSGESLGAQVAQLFSIRHPDRTDKIILNTGMMWPPDEEGRRQLIDFVERSRAAAAAGGGAITREAVRNRLNWLMFDPEKSVTEELVDIRYAIYTQPDRAAAMKKIAEASIGGILAENLVRDYANPAFLGRAKCPALILWTRHNPGQGIAVAEAALKHIPNARMVVMENSAHWPQWEEPDVFNKIHIEFLKG